MLLDRKTAVLLAASAVPAVADFGVTESDDSYVLDAGSDTGLVVTVSREDGSITSFVYGDTEYQTSEQTSHIASGLGTSDVTYTIIDDQYIKVTVVTSSDDFDQTHYYAVKSGEATVYMATDTASEPSVGELRYIARIDAAVSGAEYPHGTASTTAGGGDAIEGSDVFLVDGETRSKFYSSDRFIDTTAYGFTTDAEDVHVSWVAHPSRSFEKSSGGPFFRDINSNMGDDYGSLTFYMNSNHAQTEEYRQGFHGPYALAFTGSDVPDPADYDFSFFESLEIESYIADSDRGYVAGTASGLQDGFDAVLHWYNDDYQFWTTAADGAFTSPAIVAGTYTQVLYQGELNVASQEVTVAGGETATGDIAATSEIVTADRTTVFQIGDWDGRPTGFLNADNQLRMHPSDDRMADWGPVTFVAGSSNASDFPMAIFAEVNSPVTIEFDLDEDVSSDATLRIGTTLEYLSGRPSVAVGDYSEDFDAPTKIDSRGVTRGAYRGLGEVYNSTIPAGTLVAGTNNITIDVISGSSGEEFLSANFIFDSVELFY